MVSATIRSGEKHSPGRGHRKEWTGTQRTERNMVALKSRKFCAGGEEGAAARRPGRSGGGRLGRERPRVQCRAAVPGPRLFAEDEGKS